MTNGEAFIGSHDPGVDVMSEFAAGMTVPVLLAGAAIFLLLGRR